ncbi:MAG: hypothetical protein AAFY17_09360 [Cyanobacteria bacterium J06642_11]
MQFTIFPASTTKRELIAFCKGRVPNYSAASKQGKAALLEHVNNWIYSQDDNDELSVLLAEAEVTLADCQAAIDRGNALLGECDYSEDLTLEECDAELSALAKGCLEQCQRTAAALAAAKGVSSTHTPEVSDRQVAPTVAAYTVYFATITVGTLLLWLLDLPLLAVRGYRFARHQWADLSLQLHHFEWPQLWVPALQLAIANR